MGAGIGSAVAGFVIIAIILFFIRRVRRTKTRIDSPKPTSPHACTRDVGEPTAAEEAELEANRLVEMEERNRVELL